MVNLKTIAIGAVVLGVGVAAVLSSPAIRDFILGGSAPKGEAPPPQMRRMTEVQYRNTIADVFSPEITVVGRFEPETRISGLAAIGASQASISASGYEQYYALASTIADQVVSDERWSDFMMCDSSAADQFDSDCAAKIVSEYGEQLFRRTMSETEVTQWVGAMEASMSHVGDFHKVTGLAIEGMLSSPQYLFLVDSVASDETGRISLSDHAMASRLSYFLWNTSPDDTLMEAARNGDLRTKKGLSSQIDRMLASEKLKQGANAFFEDFLHLEAFSTIEKDKLIYPAFNQQVSVDAHEQVLKFLDYHLLENETPYPEIFTAKETFVTRPLGMIYAVPVQPSEGWELVRFPDDDVRGGLLTHVGFTALNAHPGRSSATLRGIAIRELILCQAVAPAPAAVNFLAVQDVDNPDFKTARARLTRHRTDEACASCHKFIDPIGLALENFDGSGQYRTHEHGEMIDTSGEIDGATFNDLSKLEHVISDHEATKSCVVEKMQKFATGRQPTQMDVEWISSLETKFKKSDYNIKDLMRSIVESKEFFAVASKPMPAEPMEHASNQTPERKS